MDRGPALSRPIWRNSGAKPSARPSANGANVAQWTRKNPAPSERERGGMVEAICGGVSRGALGGGVSCSVDLPVVSEV
jgi:hypothetical protein